MAMRKQNQILTHVVVAGTKYCIARTTRDTRKFMQTLDGDVEVHDPKLLTGVVDIPTSLFAGLHWSKGKASVALKQAMAKGAAEVSLEFFPA